MKSFWLIKTDLTSLEIMHQLKNLITPTDKLYVTEVTKNWTAFNIATDYPKDTLLLTQKNCI